jgi:hypothetical protein
VQAAPPLEAELDAELAELDAELVELDAELVELDAELVELDAELVELEAAEVLLDAAAEDVPPLPVVVPVLPVTVPLEALPIAAPVPLVALMEAALPPAPGPPTTWPQLVPRGASATIHPTAERARTRSMDPGDPAAAALATGPLGRGASGPEPGRARTTTKTNPFASAVRNPYNAPEVTPMSSRSLACLTTLCLLLLAARSRADDTPPAPPSEAPPPPSPAARRSSGMMAGGIALVSVSAAAAIAGGTMYTLGTQWVFRGGLCSGTPVGAPPTTAAPTCGYTDGGDGLRAAGIASIAVSIAAVGAGVPLLVVGAQKTPNKDVALSAVPALRVGAGTLSASWRF